MKAIYTTTSLSHLYKVKTFADSFLPLHPDVQLFVVLIEELSPEIRTAAEAHLHGTTLLYPHHLADSDRGSFNPVYDNLEVCCAYRPFFAEILFNAPYHIERLIYMDSDMLQYDTIEPAFEKLLSYDFLLTPHVNEAAPFSELDHELGMNRCGIYNAGFIGMRRSAETTRFLDWWKERMRQLCVIDYPRGLFHDQIWLNFVPVYFSNTYIEQDPGYNVAYWNLFQRTLQRTGSKITVNSSPLRFIHYSGLVEQDPYNMTRHMRSLVLEDGTLLMELYSDYRARLAESKALFLPLLPPVEPPKYSAWQKFKRRMWPEKYRKRDLSRM